MYRSDQAWDKCVVLSGTDGSHLHLINKLLAQDDISWLTKSPHFRGLE